MENRTPDRGTGNRTDGPGAERGESAGSAANDKPGVAPQGTTPGSPFRVVSPTRTGGGGNRLVWLALLVALAILLAYAAGLVR